MLFRSGDVQCKDSLTHEYLSREYYSSNLTLSKSHRAIVGQEVEKGPEVVIVFPTFSESQSGINHVRNIFSGVFRPQVRITHVDFLSQLHTEEIAWRKIEGTLAVERSIRIGLEVIGEIVFHMTIKLLPY